MEKLKFRIITVLIISICLAVGLLFSSSILANQRCFNCCGSGVLHTDNKIPYSGKGYNYCIKCTGCGGSEQIPDIAKRCDTCKGSGLVHGDKRVCIGVGCNSCASCKSCNTKGWK